MTLKTLADIRELVERHLSAECRERHTWQRVAGGDVNDAVIALR